MEKSGKTLEKKNSMVLHSRILRSQDRGGDRLFRIPRAIRVAAGCAPTRHRWLWPRVRVTAAGPSHGRGSESLRGRLDRGAVPPGTSHKLGIKRSARRVSRSARQRKARIHPYRAGRARRHLEYQNAKRGVQMLQSFLQSQRSAATAVSRRVAPAGER